MCDADPRTADERRADALAPAITHTDFACRCGQPDCDGATGEPPAKNAVVYVVADETSVDAATTPPAAAESAPADPESAPAETAAAETAPCSAPPPAFVFGAGILPTALLAGILERAPSSARSATPAPTPLPIPATPRHGPPPTSSAAGI